MRKIFIFIAFCTLIGCNAEGIAGQTKSLLKLKGKGEQTIYGLYQHSTSTTVEFYDSKDNYDKQKNKIVIPLVDVEYIKELSE